MNIIEFLDEDNVTIIEDADPKDLFNVLANLFGEEPMSETSEGEMKWEMKSLIVLM